MSTITPDANEALELELSDAQQDLRELLDKHNGLTARADVESGLSCDPDLPQQVRRQHTNRATSLRLTAFLMGPELKAAHDAVERLKRRKATAPVVLSAEQVRAMDETAGIAS